MFYLITNEIAGILQWKNILKTGGGKNRKRQTEKTLPQDCLKQKHGWHLSNWSCAKRLKKNNNHKLKTFSFESGWEPNWLTQPKTTNSITYLEQILERFKHHLVKQPLNIFILRQKPLCILLEFYVTKQDKAGSICVMKGNLHFRFSTDTNLKSAAYFCIYPPFALIPLNKTKWKQNPSKAS